MHSSTKIIIRKIMTDTFKNSAITLTLGFMSLIVSLLIVLNHNFWEANWTILITILGWMGTIKGVLLLVHPKFIEKFSKPILKGKLSRFMPYTTIIMGLVIGYFGFFA